VEYDSLFEILHLSKLRKAGEKNVGEVVQGQGAKWMGCRSNVDSLTMACDIFFKILPLSKLLKAGETSDCEIIEG